MYSTNPYLWGSNIDNNKEEQVVQHAMERVMLGISLKDRKTRTRIREKTIVTDVTYKALKLKWEYAGHIARGILNMGIIRTMR